MSFENRLAERIQEYNTQEQRLTEKKARQWPALQTEMKSWWSDIQNRLPGIPISEDEDAHAYILRYNDQHIGACEMRIELLVNGHLVVTLNGKKQSPVSITSLSQEYYRDLVLEFLDVVIDLRERPSQAL